MCFYNFRYKIKYFNFIFLIVSQICLLNKNVNNKQKMD